VNTRGTRLTGARLVGRRCCLDGNMETDRLHVAVKTASPAYLEFLTTGTARANVAQMVGRTRVLLRRFAAASHGTAAASMVPLERNDIPHTPPLVSTVFTIVNPCASIGIPDYFSFHNRQCKAKAERDVFSAGRPLRGPHSPFCVGIEDGEVGMACIGPATHAGA
jgi:hypothetical protein